MFLSQEKLRAKGTGEQTRNKALACIVAVNEIRAEKDASKIPTGEEFKKMSQEIMKREGFQKTLKSVKPEDLIQKALTGNGKQLTDAVRGNEKKPAMGI
ncbi:MAG: hypothetical protein IK078_12480 [Lachnospiraceae bacterium]|nr:hypothetical protein [Lachnospiraceae bacterium]